MPRCALIEPASAALRKIDQRYRSEAGFNAETADFTSWVKAGPWGPIAVGLRRGCLLS